MLRFPPTACSRLAMGAVGSNSCSPRISSQGVRLTRRIYQLTCPTSSPSRRSYLQAWLSPARTGLSDASLADFIGSSSRSVRGRTSPVWLCDASHHAILDPLPITFDALISRRPDLFASGFAALVSTPQNMPENDIYLGLPVEARGCRLRAS